MSYKIIEIFTDISSSDFMDKLTKKKEVINSWKIKNQNDNLKYSILLDEQDVEMMIDNISKTLNIEDVENKNDIKNIMILTPVEGLLPKIKTEEPTDAKIKKNNKLVDRISTEEIYEDISNGAELSQNFLLNIIFATIVCCVGIIKRDITILLAASAIAPFLSSIMAYSFSLSIGDNNLRKKSGKTLFLGILLSIFIGLIIGFLWKYLPNMYQIDMEYNIFQEMKINRYTFILALASGASAGLAITTGMPTVMAAFMLSVSLLPNMTISGIFLGNGFYKMFLDSILLLFINLILILFASQIIFIIKKIKPKTKEALQISKNTDIIIIIFCILILIFLVSLNFITQF